MAKKVWMGSTPRNCDADACGVPIDKVFIDGRTATGRWGILCKTCHGIYGVGLGTGRGQKYELINNTWVKVEG